MSRPKPRVVLEQVNKQNYTSDQILAAEAIWAVFYDNQPFNLKTTNLLVQQPGPKYRKVSFSNPGHAVNLARRLNVQFRTDKFSVVRLTQGQKIYPHDKK